MGDVPGPAPAGATAAPSALAPLHTAWLGMLTGLEGPPSEPKATCGDCVMCGGVERSGSQVTFSPNVKCCSYIPNLPNFVAGQSLQGPGRGSIAARIERRAGVTPLGLGLSYADIRRLVAAQSGFGHSAVVVCPHFVQETQGCAIWQTRNAVCSTWFCKHERGAVGLRFWHAVRDLLSAVEERVAHRCLTRGGLPDGQQRDVLGHRAAVKETIARANSGEALPETDPDDESEDWYRQMWGDWVGREQEWFARTADSVATMARDELVSVMDDARHLTEAVGQRWRDLAVHDVPDRLTFSPGAGSDATPDVLRLVGYSPFDPVVVPAALLADLGRLDGRAIALVRNEIDPHDNPLDDKLLEALHDFGIAVSSEP